MENKSFIIPQKNAGIIAKLEGNIIKETGKIDVPYHSKSVFIKNHSFVSLCFGSKPKSRRLKIFDEFGNQWLKKPEYKFKTINFKDNTVYLGGQYKSKKGELFSFINLEDTDFKLNDIQLPIKSTRGKSIDDILVRDNDLFLVDNIIYPKYVFQYDVSMPANPKHVETYELDNHGTYEHIIKGDINDTWMILFSSTVGMNGAYQHISIIEYKEDWKENSVLSFCIENKLSMRNLEVDKEPLFRIMDVCIFRNKLILLKENGLF